ncbi:MAG TPA: enoyl-CoA hydratase/isomerase family protein [Candidatus Binatia bacterium]|nr:enoyl-CoA hydratase/isomerase family protein [Candidatus Binatia bacterium]
MTRYDGFKALRVHVERRVASVTIDHPPINLFDQVLFGDLSRLVPILEEDPAVAVIVFRSADPEFFIAHADVNWILTLPEEKPPRPTSIGPFVGLLERLRTMPKVTIGAIAGIARGGGSEFLLSLDMRFASRTRTRLAQPEVALGIIPGGGGTQRLARLVGRAKALEIILGCFDLDADEAEAIGYINRVFADEDLGPFVAAFAERIASMPPDAVRLAKKAVDCALAPVEGGLIDEQDCFNESVALPDSRARMKRFLEVGGQTREAETRLASLIGELGRAASAAGLAKGAG